MKRLAKKIFKTLAKKNGEVPELINQDIPEYKEIEDPKEAKATMKAYLEETINIVVETKDIELVPKTKAIVENAKEISTDPKFTEQEWVQL